MNTNKVIQKMKENNDDFEWYPTTQEIVNKLGTKIYFNGTNKILDIGCGKGDFFDKLSKVSNPNIYKYGIEKSQTLINEMPDDIVLLGTDFMEQSLVDKKMDLIFCNPPYSQYEDWTVRILSEGNAAKIALVIPDRWEKSEKIQQVIRDRKLSVDNLGSFNFLNAERKARANVNLLLINFDKYKSIDAFDYWFDNIFKIEAEGENKYHFGDRATKKANIENQLILSENVADQLVKLYQSEMQNLFNNYKTLEQLDPTLFEDLKISIPNLKEGLKERIEGLKHLYWNMLFDRYDKITDKLTSFSRGNILKRLDSDAEIDFTLNNIFAVTLWIIKNSNKTYDEQLKNYYLQLASSSNIKMYKSNHRFTSDEWKYIKNQSKNYRYKSRVDVTIQPYMLDYRIVYNNYNNIGDYSDCLSDSTYNFIKDTVKIGRNLGLNIVDPLSDNKYGVKFDNFRDFNIYTTDGNIFANMKLYLNGNIHVKFCPDFMNRLNIEAGRLLNWFTDKKEAADNLGLKIDEVARVWGTNVKVLSNKNIGMLEFKQGENND